MSEVARHFDKVRVLAALLSGTFHSFPVVSQGCIRSQCDNLRLGDAFSLLNCCALKFGASLDRSIHW